MELVEFWRARRALLWYLAVVAACAALTAALNGHGRVNVDVNDREVFVPHVVPLSVLMSVAMFTTAGLASALGIALNRENATRELSWTRPIPRTVLAVRFIAIDLVALAVAYTVTIALIWIVVGMHLRVAVEPRTPVAMFMGTGVIAMWYALTLLLTAGVRTRGGGIAGLMWPVAVVVLVLASTTAGGIIHDVAVVLNVVNPFAYLGQIGHAAPDGSPVPLLWPFDENVRAAIVWCFAAAFCAGAVAIWRSREL